jgi:hypothetical protein
MERVQLILVTIRNQLKWIPPIRTTTIIITITIITAITIIIIQVRLQVRLPAVQA